MNEALGHQCFMFLRPTRLAVIRSLKRDNMSRIPAEVADHIYLRHNRRTTLHKVDGILSSFEGLHPADPVANAARVDSLHLRHIDQDLVRGQVRHPILQTIIFVNDSIHANEHKRVLLDDINNQWLQIRRRHSTPQALAARFTTGLDCNAAKWFDKV